MDLAVNLAPYNKGGLRLANPVMTASGTAGYGTEGNEFYDIQRLGAFICKGTTFEPKKGNPQPRIVETASGVLNAIGLQNVGIKVLVEEMAPIWAAWKIPVIVNIAGGNEAEYTRIASMLEGVPGISGIEMNISCPNVNEGGAEFGADPMTAARITYAVKSTTSLPVVVKLTPNNCDVLKVASAVAKAGADALTLINTLKGMAIDIRKRKPVLGNITGGLSGPAIKPVALRMVYEVSRSVNIPVIGSGGIMNGTDALEFIMAGASGVQVGVAGFANPRAPVAVLEQIESFLEKEKIAKITDIIGIARQ